MPIAPRPGRALALIAVALLCLAALVPNRAAGASPPPTYVPPVDAPVSDPFRPPTTPYGPGNRGLEYDTAPGTPVHAAADGVVTFAGVVAGSRHVTVLHADGLRTTVSYLATVAVVLGQRVGQGDLLGTTEGRLHLSARSGASYLDPASLFVSGPPHVWLVPFEEPPGDGPDGERSAISKLLGLGRGAVHRATELVGTAGRAIGDAAAGAADAASWASARVAAANQWLEDNAGELYRMAVAYAPFVLPELAVARLALTSFEVLSDAWQEWRRPCTDDEDPVAPPPQRRLALLVGGLGSTDTDADVDHVDTASLGYAPTDVVRFSYAGGRTPGSTGAPAGVPSNPYDAADSQQDLYLSAERLADLVEQVAASAPGAPIDLIAHSQGGIVARLALEELERRGSVDAVGLLATLATPHEGADLATAARAVGLTGGGQLVLKGLGAVAGLDPFAPTIEQLSETGDLIAHLEGTPLPDGVEAISIAGRTDPVVPAPRTQLDGATSVVIPTLNPLTAHGDLPGDPRTTRELTLALAGAPPGCRTMVESLLDQAAGQVIGGAEDGAGAGAAAELLALELEAPFRWP